MSIDFNKDSHKIFFAAILPFFSYCLGWLFNKIFPNIPFWVETISPLYAYGMLFAIYDKWCWKWKIFSFFGIVSFPDLRGRWYGKQTSSFKENGVNSEIPACLEIKQTFSKIFIRACYEKSQSESIVTRFAKFNDESYLFYTYDNEPSSLKNGTMQAHKGTMKLRYLPKEKKLVGFYFNSIGNSGEALFDFEQYNLIGRFSK